MYFSFEMILFLWYEFSVTDQHQIDVHHVENSVYTEFKFFEFKKKNDITMLRN